MDKTTFAEEIATILDLPRDQIQAIDILEQEELYSTGFHLYEVGDYSRAAQLFIKLVLCDPFTKKYWEGLASSRQMQKDYLAGIHAWALTSLIDAQDPMPHFHAAECLISLNEKQDAFKALEVAESLLTSDENALKSKISVLKKVCHE